MSLARRGLPSQSTIPISLPMLASGAWRGRLPAARLGLAAAGAWGGTAAGAAAPG
jgi:hypothetical protein